MREPANESWFRHVAEAQADADAIPFGDGAALPPPLPDAELVPWWEWQRPSETKPQAQAEQEPPTALEPLDLAALLAGPVPETPWRWRGWLARGDLALVVADPKVGKSLFMLGLAAAMRLGHPFLGAPCEQGRVGLFDFENPREEAHKRLRYAGLSAEEHAGLAYFHLPALNLATAEGQATLVETIERLELELVVIDSLRRAAPGLEENDSAAVSAVLSPLRTLSAGSGRSIVVVHHARKRIGDNPTEAGQMVRGSSDLVASVDALFYLRAKDPGSFTLEQGATRRAVPHEPILVRIEVDEEAERLELVNEGPVALADDKLEAMLARVFAALNEDGGALERPVLAVRVGSDTKDRTFQRALALGWQRGQLAKSERRVGEPTVYSLSEDGYR